MTFLLNGRPVRVDSARPYRSLLDVVRAEGLTGAKEGCAEGECGACAVAVVVDADGRAAYRVINSCLMPVASAIGHEVYTVESLAESGELADAQRVMAEAGGSQCGYCTPGFVMSLFAEQYRPGRASACDVHALSGNLCRCTGYRPIRDAARSLGPPPHGALLDRLRLPAPPIGPASIPGFSRPATIDECVAILADDPDAALVAGATDLGVDANLKGRHPRHLVGLDAIAGLRRLGETADVVSIGSAMSLADVGARWTGAPAVVTEWLSLFGSPLIRHRATLGGNLVTASPIGDAAPLLLALDARVGVAGPHGSRTISLASFFTGYRKTALGRGELLATIEIPKPLPQIVRFYKMAKRRMDDISTVAASIALDRDASGRVRRARFAFGGVAATPTLVTEAEEAVAGRPFDEAAVARVQAVLDRTLRPMSDHRGSSRYRIEVSKSIVEKCLWELRT